MTMELLAPAGNAAALRAAVQSGADAVYIGGKSFGARQSADNFTNEEIKKWADYCHLYGVDLHVTVNTLVKEKELASLQQYIKALNAANVDALIVQDIGAAEIIKNTCPDLTLHASTQMSVTTLDEVNELQKLGFKRVVLARELNEKEIEHLCKNTPLEIETFVHGAICQCYSGKCLMSSILGGRSGNRGRCAQPCRLPYELLAQSGADGQKIHDKGYLLSPKDMALINDLGTLNRIGVKSLKIEGRLKRAEYVSAVVGVYRKYLDLLYEGKGKKVDKQDMQELTDAFSRSGFTNGYLKNNLGASMMSRVSPSGTGDTKYTEAAKARTAENANIRKIPVTVMGTLKYNTPLEVTIFDSEGHCGYAVGTLKSEKAQKVALDAERLKEQLLKLGSTPFGCDDITVSVDAGITIPIKEINAVRRAAADALIAERTKRENGRVTDYAIPKESRSPKNMPELIAVVSTAEQEKAAKAAGIKTEKFEPFTGTLNVYNSLSLKYFTSRGSAVVSPELNLHEISDLLQNTDAPAELIVYGRLPLMVMKNCPINASGKCQNGEMKFRLRDRKNEEFPFMCSGKRGECTSVLLNSKPIYMADKLADITKLNINGLRLIFTVENFSQCGKIIDEYRRALAGEKVINTLDDFTRGHFYRGVL